MYRSMPYRSVDSQTVIARPRYTQAGHITTDSAAMTVMTDLTQVPAISIEPRASIVAANDKMIACGVRMLFVTGDGEHVAGLITATDILGEKPLQYLKEHGGVRDHIHVEDIMTPLEHLQALEISDVLGARVGDIIATMRDFGRQHILVVERTPDRRRESVRGIFSTTRIARQLGYDIAALPRARSFAEVGSVVLAPTS